MPSSSAAAGPHTADVAQAAAEVDAGHVVAWVEEHLGGKVVAVERLARWRPSWRLDLERDGEIVPLYARGDRGPDFPAPFSLDHEQVVHQLLEAHGFPVPHTYGIVEGPIRSLVMDRVPGRQGLAFAADDEERRSLLLRCVDWMVDMHGLDLAEVADRGLAVPTDELGIVMSGAISTIEKIYLSRHHQLDPAIEFFRGWLRRNLPEGRDRAAFVTWDSAQFLHQGGQITALIDFELAHVGDPYMDLAPLRTRDSIEPLGDLRNAYDRFAARTGAPIDTAVLRYFEISQLTASMMLAYCTLTEPDPETDLVSHMTWYTDSTWYALDILGELHGATVETVPVPEPRRSPHAKAQQHLVTALRRAASRERPSNLVRFGIAGNGAAPAADVGEDYTGWRNRCNYRLARHLLRVDQIGPQLEADDLADVGAFLGTTFADGVDANDALLGAVAEAGPGDDLRFLELFGRRVQRTHMTLGPAGSLVVRHPPLQPLPA
ncbi:MAG TPA: phosphotransferase [Acidimicrobiales bacterium]|nr:phosphotransferase [Acidimicrobiales bacterium]